VSRVQGDPSYRFADGALLIVHGEEAVIFDAAELAPEPSEVDEVSQWFRARLGMSLEGRPSMDDLMAIDSAVRKAKGKIDDDFLEGAVATLGEFLRAGDGRWEWRLRDDGRPEPAVVRGKNVRLPLWLVTKELDIPSRFSLAGVALFETKKDQVSFGWPPRR